jgi:hypothetical protein
VSGDPHHGTWRRVRSSHRPPRHRMGRPSLAQPANNGGPTFLLHGNHCGPGNKASLTFVDPLDAACARHDTCTPALGLPTEACNLRWKREAGAIAHDRRQSVEGRTIASLVTASAPSSGRAEALPAKMPP